MEVRKGGGKGDHGLRDEGGNEAKGGWRKRGVRWLLDDMVLWW